MKLKSAKLTMEDVNQKVAQREHTKDLIKEIKERFDAELEPLEHVSELLKEEIIKGMERLEMKSITMQNGDSHYVYPIYSFKFESEEKERAWAEANGHMRPDRAEMKKHLELSYRKGELPKEVEPLEKMTLGTKKAKEDLETKE